MPVIGKYEKHKRPGIFYHVNDVEGREKVGRENLIERE